MSHPLIRVIRCIAVLIAMAASVAQVQDAARFDILEFVVEGNTVLPADAF